ncbi:MAG: phosphohydrolase [Desulfofustis sp. PB-SRB1]|jgi:DNA-directed RNA polymerase subunit RPC12/RpoP|nr:phosphohydrolase [Desulfofustis sp. PB-SRB1]MBM1001129.1 phosphohydrolase [Desulfofustis sp. PB-SRB1]HBH27451.1 phosphohydrolase [Desulfofustis sp.]HBH32368.1 phosphohydrolase [Desulfofustis sp.]
MKCPGRDMQYWKDDAIYEVPCPRCTSEVEFYKDDTTRSCGACGHRFVNPRLDFGCAAYCKYAAQCVGTLPEEAAHLTADLFKDKVAVAMKKELKGDFARIGRAARLAAHAEKIGAEEQADLGIVMCAAYLDVIAHPNLSNLYPDATAERNDPHNLDRVRAILEELGAPAPLAAAVCDLLTEASPDKSKKSMEFLVLRDARRITMIEQHLKNQKEPFLANGVEHLHTGSARRLIKEILNQHA